ncbi:MULTISPECIES: DUF6381 family protein [unclassified Streptomyces]|uniref:DUF6381 family protein n=1 Tax=unclassified Streptomyces TaxID=2593676 RepID=UPI00380773C2
MGAKDEAQQRLQQMREKAQELTEAAAQAKDPKERQRLQEKARKLKSQTEQESSMGGGDILPPL